jgi:hypothetical protein
MRSNDAAMMPNTHEHTISKMRMTSEWEKEEVTAEAEVTDNRSASAQFGQKVLKKSRASAIILWHKIASNQWLTSVLYVQTQDYLACSWIEVDSWADTMCAGKCFVVHEATDETAEVSGFHDSLHSLKDVPIGTTCTAWGAPWQWTYILAFLQSLFFGDQLANSLMPPNQLCANGLVLMNAPNSSQMDNHYMVYMFWTMMLWSLSI